VAELYVDGPSVTAPRGGRREPPRLRAAGASLAVPVTTVAETAAGRFAGLPALRGGDVPYHRFRDGTPLPPPGDPCNREDTP
jgi:hypothetical protein